jgi:hypothetical protein
MEVEDFECTGSGVLVRQANSAPASGNSGGSFSASQFSFGSLGRASPQAERIPLSELSAGSTLPRTGCNFWHPSGAASFGS